jgi:hypothetical protein
LSATAIYFETIGATLRAGRLPTDADDASGFRGAVINESAAHALFQDGPAVGRQFTRTGRDTRPWTVLGVDADLRHGGPLDTRNRNSPQVFYRLDPTEDDQNQAMMVVMRTHGEVPGLAEQLRRVAQSIGPRVLVEPNSLISECGFSPRHPDLTWSAWAGRDPSLDPSNDLRQWRATVERHDACDELILCVRGQARDGPGGRAAGRRRPNLLVAKRLDRIDAQGAAQGWRRGSRGHQREEQQGAAVGQRIQSADTEQLA